MGKLPKSLGDWEGFGLVSAGARNKKFGVGKPLFWCQISIFWWKLGAENPFLGVQNAFFGVRKLWWNFLRVSMKLPGKHGGGEVNDVCVFISPPCTKTGQTFKANQGISKQIIVFQTVLGFVLSSIFTWQLYTQAQGRKNDRHRVSALCRVWHGFEWALPTWQCISTFRTRRRMARERRGAGLLLLVWRHHIRNNILKMCYRQSRRGVLRQNSRSATQ